MTKKEIQMLADLIFDRIVEKQEQMDEDYHNQVRKLHENGFIIDDTNAPEINKYVDFYISTGMYIEVNVLKSFGYQHRIIKKIK